jgi:hypothetical protein
VESGLDEGELIALAPRTIRDLVDLPKLSPDESQNIVQQVPLPEGERLAGQPASSGEQQVPQAGDERSPAGDGNHAADNGPQVSGGGQ